MGVWRLGSDNFSFESLFYIGIAEPLMTWISAVSMFSLNELPLFAFPYNFISSFCNFIPTILLPDKSSLIMPIAIEYDSPLGATSLLVSFISNFGVLGSCFVLFVSGFILTVIRVNFRTCFFQTYYCCLCAIIPFQLFRDDLAIVNKMILFNFLLLPAIIFMIEKMLSKKRINENHIR